MRLLGSRWWIITSWGPKSPKTPILGAWIGISSQICEKNQIAISSDLCIRLTWNLTGSCDQQQRLREWSRMVVKQFQDGGRPPFWKSIYRYISVKNHPIFMKVCTQQQILNWIYVTWSTRSAAVAERPRDASCLSVVSFNIPTAQFFITNYCGFRFTSA